VYNRAVRQAIGYIPSYCTHAILTIQVRQAICENKWRLFAGAALEGVVEEWEGFMRIAGTVY
jgi:hypothetical protein